MELEEEIRTKRQYNMSSSDNTTDVLATELCKADSVNNYLRKQIETLEGSLIQARAQEQH